MNPNLTANNFIISNFNSFLRHVTLIYSEGSLATINLNSFFVNQSYLPESFLKTNNGGFLLRIQNMYLASINEFYVNIIFFIALKFSK